MQVEALLAVVLTVRLVFCDTHVLTQFFRSIICLLKKCFVLSYGTPKNSDSSYNEQSTLVLTHVLFTHGDIAPDEETLYPNDPYREETYYPYGKGGLTLEGKNQAYKLGQSLKERYNVFLKDIYSSEILESTSSDYSRTKMSLQAVHAGLFPPTKEYKITNSLNWQPIPVKYESLTADKLIATDRSCMMFFDLADALEKTPPHKGALEKYKDLFEHLTKHSGWQVNRTTHVFLIQNTLKTEEKWGLTLPEWTNKIWPEPITTAASMFWKISSSDVKLRKIAMGNLLKKILDDSEQKINGTLKPIGRKIFLYSGQDFTLIPMLAALGNYDGVPIPLTSHIIFELHHINKTYGFKIYFQDYKQKNPRLLDLKGCGTFCQFQHLIDLLEDNLPGDSNWCS